MTKLLNKKGFTLIELMVVIVIVGILAAVAIPKFTMASHKAKVSEFPTVLMSIFTAEGTYMQETGSYVALASNATNAAWSVIGLDNPSFAATPSVSNYFNYSIAIPATGQFDADAVLANQIGNATVGASARIEETQAKSFPVAGLSAYANSWN